MFRKKYAKLGQRGS